ncbi:hypothetical protein ABBQ38_012455 [Trebouxia sp. C0009 RCD-2024]
MEHEQHTRYGAETPKIGTHCTERPSEPGSPSVGTTTARDKVTADVVFVAIAWRLHSASRLLTGYGIQGLVADDVSIDMPNVVFNPGPAACTLLPSLDSPSTGMASQFADTADSLTLVCKTLIGTLAIDKTVSPTNMRSCLLCSAVSMAGAGAEPRAGHFWVKQGQGQGTSG